VTPSGLSPLSNFRIPWLGSSAFRLLGKTAFQQALDQCLIWSVGFWMQQIMGSKIAGPRLDHLRRDLNLRLGEGIGHLLTQVCRLEVSLISQAAPEIRAPSPAGALRTA
jgi:hypothetical protein